MPAAARRRLRNVFLDLSPADPPLGLGKVPAAWLAKALLAVLDQGIAAGSNFVLNVLLARWLAPDAFGAFAVGFTVFLIMSAFHNALVIDPMTTLGGLVYGNRIQDYVRRLSRLHLLLCAALALPPALAAAVIGDPLMRLSLFGCAVAMPCSLSFWLLRRVTYLESRPDRAAAQSALYAAVLLLATALARRLGHLTPFSCFLIIAVASLAAAAATYAAMTTRRLQPSPAPVTCRDVAARHWDFGRWLLPAPLFGVGFTQVQLLLLARCHGLAVSGALRAITNLTLPLTHMTIALSVLAQPAIARRCQRSNGATLRSDAHLFTSALAAGNILYLAVLCWAASPLESLLYDGRFHAYVALTPLLGLTSLLTSISNGYSVALRASGNSRGSMVGLTVAGIAGAATSLAFIPRYGVTAAVLSTTAAFLASAVTQSLVFLRLTQDSLRKPAGPPRARPSADPT